MIEYIVKDLGNGIYVPIPRSPNYSQRASVSELSLLLILTALANQVRIESTENMNMMEQQG